MMTESQGKQPLISVIVPVYNVAEYLQECVDSIINQTYKNLEIILVDDGSTDACPDICDEYAKKDRRIRVIHKKNGGLSDARNAGLDICTGEWIGFVDGDDYIAHDMYEKLYCSAIENYSDVAVCHFFNKENGAIFDSSKFRKYLYESKEDMIWQIFAGKSGIISACLKLYKRVIFENIRFPKNTNYEDGYIVPYVVKKTSRMVVLPDMLYFYRIRMGSITKELYWSDGMWDEIYVYKHILNIFRDEYPTMEYVGKCRLNWAYRNNIARAGEIIDIAKHMDEVEQVRNEFRNYFGKDVFKYSSSVWSKIDSFFLMFFPLKFYYICRKMHNKI